LSIDFRMYGSIAMTVRSSLGAYMTIAMCICIVMFVGAVANWSRIRPWLTRCVPSRFPSMCSNMYS